MMVDHMPDGMHCQQDPQPDDSSCHMPAYPENRQRDKTNERPRTEFTVVTLRPGTFATIFGGFCRLFQHHTKQDNFASEPYQRACSGFEWSLDPHHPTPASS